MLSIMLLGDEGRQEASVRFRCSFLSSHMMLPSLTWWTFVYMCAKNIDEDKIELDHSRVCRMTDDDVEIWEQKWLKSLQIFLSFSHFSSSSICFMLVFWDRWYRFHTFKHSASHFYAFCIFSSHSQYILACNMLQLWIIVLTTRLFCE